MGFDVPLHIPDSTPEADLVARVMQAERLNPAEAVLSILRRASQADSPALAGCGLFSSAEDAAALDAAVELAYAERRRASGRRA